MGGAYPGYVRCMQIDGIAFDAFDTLLEGFAARRA
jgi:hypothetical protein